MFRQTTAVLMLGTVAAAAWSGLAAASTYRLLNNWSTGTPAGEVFGRVSGVAYDHRDKILVYRRDGGNVWTFDPSGKFLKAWGAGGAKRTHGIRVDSKGFVWTTDDHGHQVKKWSIDGRVLLTLGTYDHPGDGPDTFNGPTDVAVAPTGDIFVSDGYANSRIAKFSPTGKFIKDASTPTAALVREEERLHWHGDHTVILTSKFVSTRGSRCEPSMSGSFRARRGRSRPRN